MVVDFEQFVVEANDFCFFRVAPGPQQISDVEANQLDFGQRLSLDKSLECSLLDCLEETVD